MGFITPTVTGVHVDSSKSHLLIHLSPMFPLLAKYEAFDVFQCKVQFLSLYTADPDNQDWPEHVGKQKHLGGVLCPLGPAEQS